MGTAKLTVRPRTGDQVQSNFLGCSEEWLVGEHSFGREVAWTSFKWCPIDVLHGSQFGLRLSLYCRPPLLRTETQEAWLSRN